MSARDRYQPWFRPARHPAAPIDVNFVLQHEEQFRAMGPWIGFDQPTLNDVPLDDIESVEYVAVPMTPEMRERLEESYRKNPPQGVAIFGTPIVLKMTMR